MIVDLVDAPPGAFRAEISRRMVRLLAPTAILSNLIGAVVLYLLVVVVIPDPQGFGGPRTTHLDEGLFLGYTVASIAVGTAAGWRSFAPVRALLATERPLAESEQRLVLRCPLRMLTVHAVLWAIASVGWPAINVWLDPLLALKLGLACLLAGMTVCAIVYLLTERICRPAVAAVLTTRVPARTGVPGVLVRSMLAWMLGGGIPVLGLVLVGSVSLIVGHMSAHELATVMVILGGIGLLVGSGVTVLAAAAVADPINSVRKATALVERNDLSVEVPVFDGSEIGQLQAGFNHMVAGLRERERLHDLFGRHVGGDVARLAVERGVELGGELREVAVIFVDLIGSTRLAATREPIEVVGLLNEFFAVVVQVVGKHGGWINKFEGDAALAVFGAPLDLPDARTRVLATARELAARLAAEVTGVQAAVGVSAGMAVAGHIGAANRFEYTVVGDPVNEAARLTELAKATPERVLASGPCLDDADPDEAARWRFFDEVTVRGRLHPTRLFAPRHIGPELDR